MRDRPDSPPDASPGTTTPPRPPVRRTASLRPALIVLGVAAGILALFGVLAVTSGHGTPPPAAGPSRVHGTSLRAVGATRALAPIERPGTPPADVLGALAVPEGAATGGHHDNSTATTQYDEQMAFSVRAAEATVVDFYKVELKARGWSLLDVGPARGRSGAVEVLAQKGSSDGWYWEVGAVVSPTTFVRSGPRAGAETTGFTLRLFEEPDDD
jgi:hypothetical protein